METMTNELTVIPRTIGMMTRMMDVINTEEIEDAVIVSEEEQEEHPILLKVTLRVLHLKNLRETALYPVLETISLQSATRHSYTGSRRLQGAILRVKALVTQRSEFHIKFWAGFREH